MTYQNDSFIVEQFYENVYQRSETVSDNTCPECEGECQTQYCITCGKHEKECECDTPDLITEDCDKCHGRGEI